MAPTNFEFKVDRLIKKCCSMPVIGKVIRYPYAKFRPFYVKLRKPNQPPPPKSKAEPGVKSEELALAQRNIKALGRRVSQFNHFMFESMLEKKRSTSLSLDEIWRIIEDSEMAVFTPTDLFGYEKLFKRISVANADDTHQFKDADCVVFWGHHIDATRANMVLNAMSHDLHVLLMEDGFLRSVYPNVARGAPKLLRTSIAYSADYKRFTYDGYGPSSLEDLINSDRTLTTEEVERSKRLIKSIVDNKLSKYNHQPIVERVSIGRPRARKVLVIDQTVGDWSIKKGVRPPTVFRDMLRAAVDENPDADIIIKVHPDMVVKGNGTAADVKQVGHFTYEQIEMERERHPHIYIMAEDINPICILQYVDKVYVFSSHMGFEALMCGKEVVIFGMPFYAGWGMGDIRSHGKRLFARRNKTRTVEDLFYFAYVLYTKYFHPMRLEYMEIEEAIDFLVEHRKYVAMENLPTSEMLYPQTADGNVDIAFAFDANYYRQAVVAMASLLASAKPETFYAIHCLVAPDVTEQIKAEIKHNLARISMRFSIQFVTSAVDDNCFEIRGITKATYFRLLLPDSLPEVSKVIYADVDMIFREDLTPVFACDMGNHLIAATVDISLNSKRRFTHFVKTNATWKEQFANRRGIYMHAGFLVMNLDAIRKSGVVAEWQKLMRNKYHFQDMDILNITCKDRFYTLPPYYSHNPNDIKFNFHTEALASHFISSNDMEKYTNNPAVVHYAGHKPWVDKDAPKGDLWWNAAQNLTPYGNYFKWKLTKF